MKKKNRLSTSTVENQKKNKLYGTIVLCVWWHTVLTVGKMFRRSISPRGSFNYIFLYKHLVQQTSPPTSRVLFSKLQSSRKERNTARQAYRKLSPHPASAFRATLDLETRVRSEYDPARACSSHSRRLGPNHFEHFSRRVSFIIIFCVQNTHTYTRELKNYSLKKRVVSDRYAIIYRVVSGQIVIYGHYGLTRFNSDKLLSYKSSKD